MKHIFFFFIILSFLVISIDANGQYRIDKKKYDYHTYYRQAGDPYNPAVAGVTSLFLPGLGQIISSEAGRGLAFMGGAVVCSFVYIGGAFGTFDNGTADEGADTRGFNLAAAGLIGLLVVDIWSTVDAVRVAKVNNLASRDANKTSAILISPYLSSQALGVSIRLHF